MIELSECPACGRSASYSKRLGTFGRVSRLGEESIPNRLVELSQCECSHVYNNPQHDWDELAPFYSENYHGFRLPPLSREEVEAEARGYQGGKFRNIAVVPGGRYLDVGCGKGDLVALLGAVGMRAQGVEVSPIGAAKARSLGRDVFCGTLEEAAFPEASFDCVSLHHVLEHVHDPVKLLRDCRHVLKPGGDFLVVVPNIESVMHGVLGDAWVHLDVPRHLHHFSPASLEATAARAGLDMAEVTTSPSSASHVEYEFTEWTRRHLFVPGRLARLMWRTGVPFRPAARRTAAKADASGRGEFIIMNLRRTSDLPVPNVLEQSTIV